MPALSKAACRWLQPLILIRKPYKRKNMKTKIILILLFVALTSYGQTLEWENPLPQGISLTSICFIDSMNGFAAGGCGVLLKTNDGGQTWQSIETNTSSTYSQIVFINNKGWIIGDQDLLLTADGGNTWISNNSINGRSIFFTDTLNGWACNYIDVFHTNDGGLTWTVNYSDSMGLSGFKKVFFVDSLNGWVMGNNNVLCTSNHGISWNTCFGCYNTCTDIFFINDSVGWMTATGGFIEKTIDGGTNWTMQSGITANINSIYFINDTIGWAVGWNSTSAIVLRTNDGGNNWFSQYTEVNNGSNDINNDIFFLNDTLGWIAGKEGKIFKSTNGGVSWNKLTSGKISHNWTVFFLDNNNGWVGGYEDYPPGRGIIQRTIDGGNTWSQYICPSYSQAIYFTDSLTGYTAGNAVIAKSIDGGQTWSSYLFGGTEVFQDIMFTDQNNGWAVTTYSGKVHHTSDAGGTWIQQDPNAPNGLYSLFFLNDTTGWIIGDAFIWKTTDGGTNWQSQNSNTTNELRSIYFLDANNGFIAGDGGVILKTNNGGNSWVPQYLGSNYNFSKIWFSTVNNGIATCGNLKLFITYDGGANWSIFSDDHICFGGFASSFFLNDTIGWIVGPYGMILKYRNDSLITTSLDQAMNNNPETEIIYYPNPTNGIFSLTVPPAAKEIIILNSLGQIVQKTIVDRQTNFNYTLSNCGLYFIQVMTDKQTVTKKLIVTK